MGDIMINIFVKTLTKAIEDAEYGKGEIKTEAQNWLNVEDDDFCFICDMAGFDPEELVKGLQKRKVLLMPKRQPIEEDFYGQPNT